MEKRDIFIYAFLHTRSSVLNKIDINIIKNLINECWSSEIGFFIELKKDKMLFINENIRIIGENSLVLMPSGVLCNYFFLVKDHYVDTFECYVENGTWPKAIDSCYETLS